MKAFSGLIAAGCLACAAPLVQACDVGHGGFAGVSYQQMDANGDGAITKKEFDAYHNARFKELDANHDGKITVAEMEAAHQKVAAKCDVRFEARFNETDINGDGALSRDEAEIGMPMVFARFDEIDTNKDGKISMDEMTAGMDKLHEGVESKLERMDKPAQQ